VADIKGIERIDEAQVKILFGTSLMKRIRIYL
jgi:hypothetical protein